MSVYREGAQLSLDDTAKPFVVWRVYLHGGKQWAACFAPTLLHHGQINGHAGWYRHDRDGHQTVVADKVVDRALACEPRQLPRWPGQVPTISDAGWEQPIPLGRDAHLPAFPVHVLPAWLADFVAAEAVATQTPADLAGMLVLGALATAAGGRVRVEPHPGWSEPLNLYLAVAMPPGNRKSPVFAAVTAPLWNLDRDLAEKSLSEIIEAAARKDVAAAAAATAAREAAGAAKGDLADKKMADAVAAAAMAEAITVPVQPRLLADDATPEALGSLMAAQGGRIAILSDEGGVFDLMAGRYSGQANLDLYLKAWSGSPHRVDRKGRPAEFIPRPALTLTLAVQPDVLRAIADRPGFRGRGLLARFLYALPVSPLGWRIIDPPPVPEETEAVYRTNLTALVRSLAEWTDEAQLAFTDAAREALHDFQQQLEPRLGPGGDLAPVADWASKLAGELVRIAALIHLATHLQDGWRRPVDALAMGGALEIGDYLIAHAQAVFDLMGADELTGHADYVLRWLAARGRDAFIARDLYTANRTRFPTAEALAPVLAHLESFGWIRQQPVEPASGPGRRPSPVWTVNPIARQQYQQ